MSMYWWRTEQRDLCNVSVFLREGLLAGIDVWSIDLKETPSQLPQPAQLNPYTQGFYSFLRFAPAEPKFQPVASSVTAAERLLSTFLPNAELIRSRFTEQVTFFDPGYDWSGVRCPSCGADAQGWWVDAMVAASESRFEDLSIVTPCCGASASLNHLHYVRPAAFSRFVLEAMNPDASALPEHQLRQLEECLGCALRQIGSHTNVRE